MSDEEKKAAEAAKHAPVALPAGSFDVDELFGKLDKAVVAKDRDAAVSEAVEAARIDAPSVAASGTLEGLKVVEVEHPEIDGLVESTQVRDTKGVDFDEIKPGHKSDTKSAAPSGADATDDAKGAVK